MGVSCHHTGRNSRSPSSLLLVGVSASSRSKTLVPEPLLRHPCLSYSNLGQQLRKSLRATLSFVYKSEGGKSMVKRMKGGDGSPK
jgi:hypothetical protein